MIQNDVLNSAKLEGKIEGRIEGMAEGKAEGKAEEKREIAKKLKAIGISIEQIKPSGTGEEGCAFTG